MNAGLRELLGLPEPSPASPVGEFGQNFRAGIAELNQELQFLAAQTSPADHQKLDSQRQTLIAAYQQASGLGDPTKKGQIIAAIAKVQQNASSKVASATAGRDAWQKREADFDAALEKIGELEDAAHPKAVLLRQLGEAINARVNDRQYRESLTALEQLVPRLEEIHAELQNGGELVNGQSLSAQEREALWQELADIERRIESLLAEYQIAL